MNEVSKRQEGLTKIIDFNIFEDWDSFERIAQILQSYFKGIITERMDGPESRIWKMTIENAELTLHNNTYGNYLKATNSQSGDILDLIYNEWSKYSKL